MGGKKGGREESGNGRLSNAFPEASSAETGFLARDISRSISHRLMMSSSPVNDGNYVESGKEATSLLKGEQSRTDIIRGGSFPLGFN